MSINDLLDEILEREGGFVNLSADRGGATNFGITQAVLAEHRGAPVTVSDVKALTEEEARDIYRKRYIYPFGAVPNRTLLGLLVDMAVNHGLSRAVKILQRVVQLKEDGVLGPKTQAALQAAGHHELYLKILAERIRFRGRIITADPSQAVFAAGWANRDASFVERG